MNEALEDINDRIILDIPYPRNLVENIKNGKQYDFLEIIKGGIIFSFACFKEENVNLVIENLKRFADNLKYKIIFIDVDDLKEQFKKLSEITSNTKISKGLVDFLFSQTPFLSQLYQEENLLYSVQIVDWEMDNNNKFSIIFVSTKKDLLNPSSLETIIELQKIRHLGLSKSKIYNHKIRNIFTKSIRHEVLKKYNYKCVECGKTKEETSLEIDHIIPVSRGGTDELDNLQILCKECNLSKKNRILTNSNDFEYDNEEVV